MESNRLIGDTKKWVFVAWKTFQHIQERKLHALEECVRWLKKWQYE